MSLSAALLENADVDTHAVATLADLEDALSAVRHRLVERQDALRDLVGENRDSFAGYLRHLDELEALWRPLEVDFARRMIEGDPTAMELAQQAELLGRLEEEAADGDDEAAYIQYLERHLKDEAAVLARLPDYEKTTVEGLAITQKTRRFADEVRAVASATRGPPFADAMAEILPAAVAAYVESFKGHFGTQLAQLPHLAALFYNDCHYLGDLLRRDCGAEGVSVETLGSRVLQTILDRSADDVAELCSVRVWDRLRHGQLDAPSLEMLQRALAQGYLQVGQIARVFRPILPRELFAKLATTMTQQVLEWLWGGLLRVRSVSRDALPLLPAFVQSVSQGAAEILGGDEGVVEFEVCRKLEAVVKMSQHNLIQVSNAFRRDEYIDVMTLGEFRSIVASLFPDTAMKTAFLAEIDAEIN